MVQSVQQTTVIPQMPFVFRWSMPLLCRLCGSTGCSSPCTAHCLVRLRIQVCVSLRSISYLRELEDYGS